MRRNFFNWLAGCLLIIIFVVVPLLLALFSIEWKVLPRPPLESGAVANEGFLASLLFLYMSLILPALLGGIVQLTILWLALPFVVKKIPVRLAIILSTLILPLLILLYASVNGLGEIRNSIQELLFPLVGIPIGLTLLAYGLLIPLPPLRVPRRTGQWGGSSL